jgi:hypothetical protein
MLLKREFPEHKNICGFNINVTGEFIILVFIDFNITYNFIYHVSVNKH